MSTSTLLRSNHAVAPDGNFYTKFTSREPLKLKLSLFLSNVNLADGRTSEIDDEKDKEKGVVNSKDRKYLRDRSCSISAALNENLNPSQLLKPDLFSSIEIRKNENHFLISSAMDLRKANSTRTLSSKFDVEEQGILCAVVGQRCASPSPLNDKKNGGKSGFYERERPSAVLLSKKDEANAVKSRVDDDFSSRHFLQRKATKANNLFYAADIDADGKGKVKNGSYIYDSCEKTKPTFSNERKKIEKNNFSKISSGEKSNFHDENACTFPVNGENTAAAAGYYGTGYYYAKDSPRRRRRFVFQNRSGRLRAAKSESNLRMAAAAVVKKDFLLSDKEIYQIEIMNSGLSVTRVYVAECLANLYFDDGLRSISFSGSCTNGERPRSSASNGSNGESRWRRIATGVPVLIQKTGQERQLLLRLSEVGNGFRLWEDVIDSFSGYSCDRTFHTMAMSTDSNKKAGLSFDSQSAAMKFYHRVKEFADELEALVADEAAAEKKRRNKRVWSTFKRMGSVEWSPVDPNAYQNHGRPEMAYRRRVVERMAAPLNALKKTDISMPCCFKHVTSLKPGDATPLSALMAEDHAAFSSTLTRANRTATIQPYGERHYRLPSNCTDSEYEYETYEGGPKRSQSCTQILVSPSGSGSKFTSSRMTLKTIDDS